MGLFKKIFGKEICTLCGAECGVMSRYKLSDGEYICNSCADKCSKYIRISRFNKEEIKGHMEYMARQQRLFDEVFSKAKRQMYPSTLEDEGIEFCDELGMFRIVHRDKISLGKIDELFRYDQVIKYEEYCDMEQPQEQGGEPKLKECGIKIAFLNPRNANDVTVANRGLKPHPYIQDEIKICFSKRDKQIGSYSYNAKCHFDHIFGVHDNEHGLFGFGMNKAEKRELEAGIGMAKIFSAAVKVAKEGQESLTDEMKQNIQGNLNAVQDAQTGGLSVYTRRADEAESKIS